MNNFHLTTPQRNWSLLASRYLFNILNGSTPTSSEASYWDGEIFWATPEDIGSLKGKVLANTRRKITQEGYENCGATIAPAESIVLTTRAPVGNLAISTIPLCTNQGCRILVPKNQTTDASYFYYQLIACTKNLQILSSGTTFYELTSNELSSFKLLVPSFEEQRAIAAMLDAETARLDELIAEKERLLLLLAEKRRALITRAVTRGLDDNAPLRDSGLEWLGEVPEHWRVERLKFQMGKMEQGWSPLCYSYPAEGNEWGVLKVGAVNGWEFNPIENKKLPEEIEPLEEYVIKPGDILMSRANTTELLGSVAMVKSLQSRLLLCDKLYRLVIKGNELVPDYLVFFFRSSAGRFQLEREATGASNSMQNIGQDSVKNAWILLPPVDEQRAIIDYIATETRKLDEMHEVTKSTIGLLQERRAALIAAAVTGQIDVQNSR